MLLLAPMADSRRWLLNLLVTLLLLAPMAAMPCRKGYSYLCTLRLQRLPV